MTDYYDDSFISDGVCDAATRAGWDFISDEPYTDRDVRIVRQCTRVEIAAALLSGLEARIRADERARLGLPEAPAVINPSIMEIT